MVDAVENAREALRNFLLVEVRAERKSAVVERGIDIRWSMFESLMEDLRVAAATRATEIARGTTVSLPDETYAQAINARMYEAAAVRETLHADLRHGPQECKHDCACTCTV